MQNLNNKVKLILKVLVVLVILIFGANIKTVNATYIPYYAIKLDNGYTYYSTYTAAYEGEVKIYSSKMDKEGRTDNNKTGGQYLYNGWHNSYWVMKASDHLNKVHDNSSSFRGIATIFHTQPLSTYKPDTDGKNIKYGYSVFSGIKELNYNNMTSNEDLKKLSISAEYLDGLSSESKENYEKHIIYGVGFGNRDTGKRYYNFTSNGDSLAERLHDYNNLDYGHMGYKFCIVAGKEDGEAVTDNIYAGMAVLNSSQTNKITDKITEAIKNKKITKEGEYLKIYFSDITERGSFTEGENHYYMVTASEFMKTGWGSSTRGVAEGENALGSGLNLYDNILYLPDIEKQTLVIKHIDIDTNTTISTDIVDKSPLITGGTMSTVKQGTETATTSDKNNYSKYGYNKSYDVEYGTNITITPLTTDTTRLLSNDNGNIYGTGYYCLGYNFSIADTFNNALTNVRNLEKNKKKSTYNGNSISINNTSTVKSKKIIVVNIYYSTYEQDVKVKNVLVSGETDGTETTNGMVKLYGNNKIYSVLKTSTSSKLNPKEVTVGGKLRQLYTGEVLNSISSSKYEEHYKKPLNRRLILANTVGDAKTDLLSRSTELKASDVIYLGYHVFDNKTEYDNFEAGNMTPNNSIDLDKTDYNNNNFPDNPFVNGLFTNDTNKDSYVVCFYKYKDQNIYRNINQDIDGKIDVNLYKNNNITTENKLYGICNNRYFSVPSTVKNVTTSLIFGVTDIPKVLIKGIELLNTNKEITITFNYTLNNIKKTSTRKITINCYKVKNLMISMPKNITMYMPGYAVGENTSGDVLFNKGTYRITPNLEIPIYSQDEVYTNLNTVNLKGNFTSQKAVDATINSTNYNFKYYPVIPVNIGNVKLFGESESRSISLSDTNNPTVSPTNSEYPSILSHTSVANYYKTSLTGNMDLESYIGNTDVVAKNIKNGIRRLSSKVEYENVTLIKNEATTDNTNNRIAHTFIDNFYYSDDNNENINNGQSTYYFAKIDSTDVISKKIEAETINENETSTTKYSGYVNIYTPITVETSTYVGGINSNQIKQFEDFEVRINQKTPAIAYEEMAINQLFNYDYGYYIKFAFDVIGVKINDRLYKNGEKIPAGTWIGIIPDRSIQKYGSVTARTYYSETEEGTFISSTNNSYIVRAVAITTPNDLLMKSLEFELKSDTCTDESTDKQCDFINSINNVCSATGYFAETTSRVIASQLLYDFRITDVKDVNFKSVFRNVSSNAATHKGILYYSGIKEILYNATKKSTYNLRKTNQIGSIVKRILPIGPYKNTDTSYVKAPKLGYRFSFDMKLTGTYDENNEIIIEPTFYYISKTGDYNTLLEEYTSGSKKGIYLFYKNSSGKYVRIGSSSDTYNIYYTPGDLYRYTGYSSVATNHMSNKSISIGTLKNITLKANESTIEIYNKGLSSWYGEYKLPNSTIAVAVNENGKYDINKPLTNGYIGIRFNIAAYDKDEKETANYASQWSKEGYLGYDDSISYKSAILKLEKGNLTLDTIDKYNKIKGTVMLYDIDKRADTDFE